MSHIRTKATLELLLAAAFLGGLTARAATFYVDAVAGRDSNWGGSPAQPWATIVPVNAHHFGPGDQIFFHAGQTWAGELTPRGNGTREKPIFIDRYGDGPKPLFTGDGGKVTLALRSVSGWTLQNIAVTNHGTTPTADRVGVLIHTTTFSFAIHLFDVDVSDVNGEVGSKSAGGISIYAWNDSKGAGDSMAHFDDVLIDHCTVKHVDGQGIFYHVKFQGSGYPNSHIRLTGTTIEDTGRNAVFLRGAVGAMIDHNTIRLSSARTHGNALCVAWAKDTLVRANDISETGINTGLHENGAIDLDDGAIGTIVEFNWTHDNVGGSVNAAAQPGRGADASGSVIRYNLSENDGERAFAVAGAMTDTNIYNNTIYVGRGHDERVLKAGKFTHYPQLPQGISFERNIVYNDGNSSFELKASDVVVDNNCYFGRPPKGAPRDSHVVVDKSIPLEGIPINQRADAVHYALPAHSACDTFSGGLVSTNTSDFFGNLLGATVPAFHGAIQPRPEQVR